FLTPRAERMKLSRKLIGTGGWAIWLVAASAAAVPSTNIALTITAPWRYTTDNVDAENWTATDYSDAAWSGPGNALLYIETAPLPAPTNTALPQRPGGGPMPCYYFRTTFQVT